MYSNSSKIFLLVLLQTLTAWAFKAAVLEYHPTISNSNNPKEIIKMNLDEYRTYVEMAKKQGVKIIVFPEYGLTSIVTDPTEYAFMIHDEEPIIKELKDMAIGHDMYLVVNLLEKEEEPNKARKFYNTNLVFKNTGEILLKYRKINLYMEEKLTPGDPNQTLTFSTNFGQFGIFTCFDILFENPARRVLENKDVGTIAYPTAWISTLPFFSSLSVQHGYALSNGVNLLAANLGDPKNAYGGSGIYQADGLIIEKYIGDTPSSKLIVQEITKNERVSTTECSRMSAQGLPGPANQSNVANYKTFKSFNQQNYKFENVDLSQAEQNKTVCYDDFCCHFAISLFQTNTQDYYKLVAYDGIEQVDNKNKHFRFCSMVACAREFTDSCAERVNTSTVFKKIEIVGDHKTEEGSFYIPISLNFELESVQKVAFCKEDTNSDTAHIEFFTTQKQKDLLIFGIVGTTRSSGSLVQGFGIVLLLSIAFARSLFI